MIDSLVPAEFAKIMKNLRLLLIFPAIAVLLSSCLMSQQYQVIRHLDDRAGNRRFDAGQFSAIDAHAIQAPAGSTESFDRLAAYLANAAKTDLERVRGIWRWITAHIAYDTAHKNYTAAETLRDRRGTCQGYSELFVELARRAGVRAIEITGYTRGADYIPGQPVKNNHAWNAVCIDHLWYLLDCTQGAGTVSGDVFRRDYREHYFLTPPGEFVYSNLAELRRWQLIPAAITKKEFERLPMYRHGYFRYGLKQIDGNRSSVIYCGRELKLSFKTPADVKLTVNLRDAAGKTIHHPGITRNGGTIDVLSVFPQPGEYLLIGWASPAGRPKAYAWAFIYLVNVR